MPLVVFVIPCRHAAEKLQQSLEREQAHSHSLLLQLQQMKVERELPAGGGVDQTDDNQRSPGVEVSCIIMYMLHM